MINRFYDKEYIDIIKPVLELKEFTKTKNITHHGITRYDHLIRVSYYSYKVTKILRLNYKETARAAVLHDFFLDKKDDDNKLTILKNHPNYALENARKYFELTNLEEDIIKTHMFPVTVQPPKYMEGIIVDLVDDFCGIYERYHSTKKEFKAAVTFLCLLFINFISIK